MEGKLNFWSIDNCGDKGKRKMASSLFQIFSENDCNLNFAFTVSSRGNFVGRVAVKSDIFCQVHSLQIFKGGVNQKREHSTV